ncbi:MAG: MBL fold metallo-hydrolase [Planctomycetota bacterium]
MIRYVKKKSGRNGFVTPLFKNSTGNDAKLELLWGDRVRVISSSGSRWKVKARGMTGFVDPSRLQTNSLLELYFIDVGQGDGVLIRTPDDKHILIDGGWPRRSQPTGKNAADFVDWKFDKDYERDDIHIDTMICSHNDQDHYGGLWDLLDADQHLELNVDEVTVGQFYHAGMSWWKLGSNRVLGPSESTSEGDMWTRLLEDRASMEKGLSRTGSHPKLQGEWAKFLRKVKDAKTPAGTPTPVERLSHATGRLSEYDSAKMRIHVLAPVEFEVDGKPAIRKFPDGDSKNTNGNSVLLRLDFGKARFLLTGDLNLHSQQSLLKDYAGQTNEFAADVAKACHHGSGDVSISFLETIEPSCTIISSGDSEGHDHPKPEIIAASGLTGRQVIKDDKLVTPLVYSTELARSIALGRITKVEEMRGFTGSSVAETYDADELKKLKASYEVVDAGARNPKSGSARLANRRLASATTYGLINVRTDGSTIMCAALNEKKLEWNVTSFKARF